MKLSKDQVTNSLRQFVSKRDALLHEDSTTFEHHLQRFVELCRSDPLVQSVMNSLSDSVDVDGWWESISSVQRRDTSELTFPPDPNRELLLRFRIIETVVEKPGLVYKFGSAFRALKREEAKSLFLSLIVRPLVDEMSYRLGEAANLATPEERALQAVPLKRIPNKNETRIFLSHKSVDKPLVYRYYQALKLLGFEPWLDEPELPAGKNFEREIFKGFDESCAAVFFITENFKDEKYLAAEVDYAIMQKRKKGDKFAIITLRYSGSAPVPDLLTLYNYKNIDNDLDGLYELLRALPIELGPVRWKAEVVAD